MTDARSIFRSSMLSALAISAIALGACHGNRPYADMPEDATPPAIRIDNAAKMVRHAQRLEVAGDIPGAIAKYRAAIEEYREIPVAWNNLGDLLAKQNDYMAAQDAFLTASELSPTDPRPLYNLGALWEERKYFDDALKWYDQALTRDEQYQPALRRYLLVQSIQNKPGVKTAERLKTALLLEKDPWWVERLQKFHLKTDEGRVDATPDSMPK
jgi:tetratricopeptide (TPR) repeat protein